MSVQSFNAQAVSSTSHLVTPFDLNAQSSSQQNPPGGGNNNNQQQQYAMIKRYPNEAQAIMRRDRHLFKLGTIYVVDKLNFKFQKLHRALDRPHAAPLQKVVDTGENLIKLQEVKYTGVEGASLNGSPSDQKSPAVKEEKIYPPVQTHVRGSSAPIKGQHPCHFKHGSRTNKRCLVCEGLIKQSNTTSNNPLAAGGASSLGNVLASVAESKGPGNHSVAPSKQPEDNTDRKTSSFLAQQREDYNPKQIQDHQNPKVPHSLDGNASERGFDLTGNDNSAAQIVSNKNEDSTPNHKTQKKSQAPKQDESQSVNAQDTNDQQAPAARTQIKASTLSTAVTRRDGDIEEYQRRRINLSDFMQGQPSMKVMFTKHVRKFNRELLKATCLVIGCKRIYANKIADKLFDEFDQILNNLSDNIDFDQHFEINTSTSSHPEEQEEEKHIQQKSSPRRFEQPDSRRHITTVTVSAPLFKYVLKKYLVDKFKYSRPEYLKDFYVASDLVQSKRNILVLLAGTSGTGKSTLSSLLGSRLGISTVLSTDTIRHVMRNFIAKEDDPIIFASTYETAAFVSEDIQSKKKRTLMGYKDQCYKVQAELEKVIDDYQRRNESLVVEGVHLTVRFMLNMMKKYPSCIPFVICITNEDKHKERFAVRTKHMTIDPRFNKYIKNVSSIRTIQKHLIKKAEAALIPRIDNSNIDKSIGLIHATIVRCLRQIAEGTPIFDAQRKQATIMYQEFANISKNKLSSKDAQQFIHQKVNKTKIIDEYMKSATLEEKLKWYKKSQSMGDLKQFKGKKKPTKPKDEEEEKSSSNIPKFQTASGEQISTSRGNMHSGNQVDVYSDEGGKSPRAKSIHVIMRPDDEEDQVHKITDLEKKLKKKELLQNDFHDFPEEEETFEDSKAAQLVAASSSKPSDPQKKEKKEKAKKRVVDEDQQRQRDERKRQSDQQKQIEEEKIQQAILEAQKKEKEELERIEAEKKEAEKIITSLKKQTSSPPAVTGMFTASPSAKEVKGQEGAGGGEDIDNLSSRPANRSFDEAFDEVELEFDRRSADDTLHLSRRPSSNNDRNNNNNTSPPHFDQPSNIPGGGCSPSQNNNLSFNITNVKQQMKKETTKGVNDELPAQQESDASTETKPFQSQQKMQELIDTLQETQATKQLYEVHSAADAHGSSHHEHSSSNQDSLIDLQNFHSATGVLPQVLSLTPLQQQSAEQQETPSNLILVQSSVGGGGDEDSKSADNNKLDALECHEDSNTASGLNDNMGGYGDPIMIDGSKTTKEKHTSKTHMSRLGSAEQKQRLSVGGIGSKKHHRDQSGEQTQKISRGSQLLFMGSTRKTKKKKVSALHGNLIATSKFALAVKADQMHHPQQIVQDPSKAIPSPSIQKLENHQSQTPSAMNHQDETQSVFSEASGLAPSLISQSVNFFPQSNTHDDDMHSQAAQHLERISESSDDTNSQDAEASDHEAISEEVSYSHSSESDNEEDQEDAIDKKQTSFNTKNFAGQQESQVAVESAASTPKQGMLQSKSQEQTNQMPLGAFNISSTTGADMSSMSDAAYDKPISKKSFEEDAGTQSSQGGKVVEQDLQK